MKQILNKLIILAIAITIISCDNPPPPKEKKEEVKVEQVVKVNELSQAEIEDGWVSLFDGKTTEHWRGYNSEAFPTKGWIIENDAIKVLSSGKGEAGGGGDIISMKKYKNFEFCIEWKVSEGGNSGIFYLAQEKPGQPIWKSAPEMQILDNEKHPDGMLGKDGNRAAGSLYDLIPGDKKVVNPAGQWNKAKLLVYKGTVVHWMNDVKVLEYHLWTEDWNTMVLNSKFKDYEDFLNTADEGYIGLQDHGDDVWFRNIKIKEM